MAVVQISKIQVRRGQKNSNSGIPQLSSAEFAWAVDSQELFIGNGSVAEGAPYVGNTKILTEHDNILDLASSYQYAHNDTSITLSIPRNLQSKLDEYVSVTDFGAVGDGSTDCVAAFETAFDQLFNNTNPNYKKVLMIPNGEYLFLNDLRIPDNVIMRGETQLGTILQIGDNNIRFVTADGYEFVDTAFASSQRPHNINISNLTISRTTGQVAISGIYDSVFSDIKFHGNYVLGDSIDISSEPAAIFWEDNSFGTRVNNVEFKNCFFEGNGVSVNCLQTSILPTEVFETNVNFSNCKFFVSDTAIYVNSIEKQINKWQIYGCEFEEISSQAFRSTNGRGTIIQECRFKNVGNSTNGANLPVDVMVYFGEKVGNVVINCISDRQQYAGITVSENTTSYTEVYNSAGTSFVDKNYSVIGLSDSFTPFAVISALNKFTKINYSLELGNHTRYGNLTLVLGDDLAGEEDVTDLSITDSYTYSPRFILSDGGALMTNFQFKATLRDNDLDSGLETIVLSYKNPRATGATGSISFDVTYGV